MAQDNLDKAQTQITLEGITFKTGGNIVFASPEESPFLLAQSTLLENMDGFLEHGMQMFLKKIKS